jgi:hypothetical protein
MPSQAGTPADVNLTTEGTIDWVQWGLVNNTDVNHKSSGPSAITLTTNGTLTQFGSYTPTLHWSDGTPTANAQTNSGVWVGNPGDVLTVTVPADTTTRTLRLYLTSYHSTGILRAHLSDGSATDFMTAVTVTGNVYNRYTFTFRAAYTAQTLTVTWALQSTAGAGASVDIMAATLY